MLGALALSLEAAAWRRADRRVRLWWRDDDARAPTPALRRLIALSAREAVPLALAVIPQALDADLADVVNAAPTVSVLQHGIDHVSRRAFGQPPAQFSDDQSAARTALEIEQSGAGLAVFARRRSIYVPPWNAIQPALPVALAALNMGLSAYGGDAADRRIDVHLDLLRWGDGRPRFRGADRLLRRLAKLMRQRRRARDWDQPIGLLTHHLDHDAAAWAFLERLFSRLARTGATGWLDAAADPAA